MKKLLTIAAIAAASTALAVESSNTFGILRVDSSAKETVVAIPWLAAGGTSIAVKDVVKTAGLHDNDQLYYYNKGEYKLWVLQNGAWVGTRSVKDQDGGKVTAAEGDDTTLARGGAIILVRENPASEFYLYGQYTSDHAEVTPIASGKTLIAPPIASNEGFDLNKSGAMTGTPSAGDYIVVDLATILTYNTVDGVKKWSVEKTTFNNGKFTTSYDTAPATIPSGKGVWYVSTGSSVPVFNF